MSNPTPTDSHCRRCGEEVLAAASECPRCGPPTGPPLPSGDAPGGILDGKWALERQLGKGAMGTVWLATDLELDRKVAIKMLAERYAADAGLVARFEREARMMARLDHPNLVPIYAVGRQDGVHFIVMKLLEGKTLGDTLPFSRQRRARMRAAQEEAPAETAKPLYRGPLPANLPKRVAINGKLLSVEETEQYFREKLVQNPPGDH